MFQGDANRSYSEEDQSSSNIEELDQFQEVQEGSGMIAQTASFACILLLFSKNFESIFSRKFTPIFKVEFSGFRFELYASLWCYWWITWCYWNVIAKGSSSRMT